MSRSKKSLPGRTSPLTIRGMTQAATNYRASRDPALPCRRMAAILTAIPAGEGAAQCYQRPAPSDRRSTQSPARFASPRRGVETCPGVRLPVAVNPRPPGHLQSKATVDGGDPQVQAGAAIISTRGVIRHLARNAEHRYVRARRRACARYEPMMSSCSPTA